MSTLNSSPVMPDTMVSPPCLWNPSASSLSPASLMGSYSFPCKSSLVGRVRDHFRHFSRQPSLSGGDTHTLCCTGTEPGSGDSSNNGGRWSLSQNGLISY